MYFYNTNLVYTFFAGKALRSISLQHIKPFFQRKRLVADDESANEVVRSVYRSKF